MKVIIWGVKCTKGRNRGKLVTTYGYTSLYNLPFLMFHTKREALDNIKRNYVDADENGEMPIKVTIEWEGEK